MLSCVSTLMLDVNIGYFDKFICYVAAIYGCLVDWVLGLFCALDMP